MGKKLLIALSMCAAIASAQKKDNILLTVADQAVYTSEFKQVYLKNIDLVKDESQKDVDEYLDLFINYKLKLKEAESLGLDQKESYKKELSGYKKQLSENYLTDTRATEALIKEAYDRTQERVNASHILIKLDQGASPTDTLKAYQKITKIRERIVNGEDFKAVARQASEDPSAKRNAGDLGWFSAFRMVYAFEDVAYKTEVGNISQPFRSQFGYHILKVNAKEKIEGEVTVAHIMIGFNADKKAEEAETKIREISTQLTEGASFEALAKQYSDDRNTAVNGGKMNRFGKGALKSELFEKTAFSLKDVNELSKPIKTKYGWHIIKLIEKHPLPSFESEKNRLTKRVRRDSRSQKITKAFINNLKKKYQVERNEEAINAFKNALPVEIIRESTELTGELISDKTFQKIGEIDFSYNDFATFVNQKSHRRNKSKSIKNHVELQYEAFMKKEILAYYESRLEFDNEDFGLVYNEYKNGLLLFDLMETQIWNKAKEDSVGLNEFYQAHIDSYKKDETYQVIKASTTNKKLVEKVAAIMKEGTDIEQIKKEFKGEVLVSNEKIEKGDAILPKKFKTDKGSVTIVEDKKLYTILKVEEKYAPEQKKLEDIKGKVLNDFQIEIEEKWMEQLKNKYPVSVHKKGLKKVKKELKS